MMAKEQITLTSTQNKRVGVLQELETKARQKAEKLQREAAAIKLGQA